MSEFFRELEDDIKQDRFNSLVKKVLPIIIVIILAVIISISSFVIWKKIKTNENENNALMYLESLELLSDQKYDESIKLFLELSQGKDTYGILSKFGLAATYAKNGQETLASNIYFEISKTKDIDIFFKELAILKLALHNVDMMPSKNIEEILVPLEDSTWKYFAKEIMIFSYIKNDETIQAQNAIINLLSDPFLPPVTRSRVSAINSTLIN
jgi:hypothetical protein